MARLPTSFATNYPITPPLSPAASEEDISTQLVTQTAGHPYIGQVIGTYHIQYDLSSPTLLG